MSRSQGGQALQLKGERTSGEDVRTQNGAWPAHMRCFPPSAGGPRWGVAGHARDREGAGVTTTHARARATSCAAGMRRTAIARGQTLRGAWLRGTGET